jgi:CubicO group peptidase (beta-lactamase class C family)
LKTSLDAQFKPRINASAISISVKSIHEDSLLFNYHFTPPKLSAVGTRAVDENTIYRVGSISKLMPVLALLQSGNVSFDDPVTEYIPELRNAAGATTSSSVAWDDITVGALASHLAGLGTDCTFICTRALGCRSLKNGTVLTSSSGHGLGSLPKRPLDCNGLA